MRRILGGILTVGLTTAALTACNGEMDPHAGELPTAVPTLEERGWYEVPTFEWDPAQGGEAALLEGIISMTDDGCAIIESDGDRTGLVYPNALGRIDDGDEGGRTIFVWLPETMGAAAENGAEVSLGGGFRDLTGDLGEQWQRLCANSPVDSLLQVYDGSPWSW